MAGRDRLTDASETRQGVPEFVGRPGPSAVHWLNPLTKATLATVTAVAAVVLGGLAGPIALVAIAVLIPALLARVFGRLVRTALLLSLPIAISAFLVNLFFLPGAERVLLRIGPITATAEGLGFALEILVRILAISGAVTLFYLTTQPRNGYGRLDLATSPRHRPDRRSGHPRLDRGGRGAHDGPRSPWVHATRAANAALVTA